MLRDGNSYWHGGIVSAPAASRMFSIALWWTTSCFDLVSKMHVVWTTVPYQSRVRDSVIEVLTILAVAGGDIVDAALEKGNL